MMFPWLILFLMQLLSWLAPKGTHTSTRIMVPRTSNVMKVVLPTLLLSVKGRCGASLSQWLAFVVVRVVDVVVVVWTLSSFLAQSSCVSRKMRQSLVVSPNTSLISRPCRRVFFSPTQQSHTLAHTQTKTVRGETR